MRVQCILEAMDKLQTPERTEVLHVEDYATYGNVKLSIFSDKNVSIVVDRKELIQAVENAMNN